MIEHSPNPAAIRRLRWLIVITLIATLSVIVLGAFTRLADAGLGCPDWPTCYGHLWVPNSADDIATANQAFPDTPVLAGKTWPEQFHRILASSLGLLCLVVLFQVLRYFPRKVWSLQVTLLGLLILSTIVRAFIGHQLDILLIIMVLLYFSSLAFVPWQAKGLNLRLPLFVAGWVVLQGLFGMWTVTLKLWPQVVTLHLLGGFTLLSVLWWQSLRLTAINMAALIAPIKTLAQVGLVVVVIQITLGGWTTSNYAALACPDLPYCQGQLWPDPDFAEGFNVLQHVGPNYLGGQMDNGGRVAIHLAHRIGAITVTLVLGWLAFALYRLRSKKLALLLATVLTTQVALGISNVAFFLPLPVAVLHNLFGALLLLTLITINYCATERSDND
jgi:cytochrome c oxidase assembly protein subunit 15